jgi:hypothetical protein
MPAPRIITFKLKDTEKNMRNINPFYIQKALDGIAGKVKNASRLKNGTLLVEVQNDKQAEVLMKANILGSYPIQVERHTSLNYSRGVVKTDSLDDMSDEVIQSAPADQFVPTDYRLIGKRDNNHNNHNSHMHQPFAVFKVLMPQRKPQLCRAEASHHHRPEQQYPLSLRFPPRLKTSQPPPCQL